MLCGGEKGMRETSGYGSSPNFSSVHIKCETSGYPYQVCILSKKLYLRSKVACGGGQLGGIFNLFFILLFSCFFFYFLFFGNTFVRHIAHLYKSILSCEK